MSKAKKAKKEPTRNQWAEEPSGKFICTATKWGHSTGGSKDPDRCKRTAVMVQESYCGCGQVHMTLYHCLQHHISMFKEKLKKSRDLSQSLINTVRKQAPKKFKSDDDVLLYIHGIEQYPAPEPHPIGKCPKDRGLREEMELEE